MGVDARYHSKNRLYGSLLTVSFSGFSQLSTLSAGCESPRSSSEPLGILFVQQAALGETRELNRVQACGALGEMHRPHAFRPGLLAATMGVDAWYHSKNRSYGSLELQGSALNISK